ncbi:MAG: anaerobic ribonucleoside-triphosphate reductase activating protein [Candidatus Nealsonbacteria bacterium]|nr:anaerobic ribonucleoside-triphosphate reductase activating protein [Candidatus Nealsonbacteria bacterium]
MIIGGLQKLTLIDYPGKLAATVFLAGCNFRCPWCYSSELVLPAKIKSQPKVSQNEFFEFLNGKKGLLEGVVICGGEPTLNKDLMEFIGKIKEMGFTVKLDTNGSNPEILKELLEKKMIDYVAMDIKAPKEKYKELTGKKIDLASINKSVDLLLSLPINARSQKSADYEFRTTLVPNLLNKEDIISISRWISGAERYYIQNFRPEKNIEKEYEGIKPYPDEYVLDIVKAISPFFGECQMR